jgi:hypothetical protein
MAFDISAFFGGLSEGVAKNIEQQDKRIREQAVSEFDRLKNEAVEQESKVKTRRDELKATASVLATYKGINNVGFTQGQIVGMLQNPAVAKRVMSVLDKNADELDQIDFSKLYTVSKGGSDQTVDEYIKQRTTFNFNELTDTARGQRLDDEYKTTREAWAKEQDPNKKAQLRNRLDVLIKENKPTDTAPVADRGVFGLPTRARNRAEKEFERTSGLNLAELRVKAKGIPDEAITAEGTVDFSQFKEPDSIDKQINRVGAAIVKARDAGDKGEEAKLMSRVKTLQDVKNTIDPEKANYASVVSAKKLAYAQEKDPAKKARLRDELADLVQADRVGKSEAPSLTEFNSLLSRAEKTALQGIKGPVPGLTYNKDEGRFVYTGADPHYRAVVENARLAGIRNVVDLFSDADGKVSQDLRASLAASGVQFDADGKPILEVPVPPKTERPQQGNRGPRVQAGQTVPAAAQPAPAAQGQPLPIPKNPDGSIDGSKLQPGQKYSASNGTVKTWTGTGWQ